MSLERELVFQLRDEGNSLSDVLEIVKYMADPNGKGRAVRTNTKKIQSALSQYEARKELEKREEYKKRFKDKLKGLIEEKKREIEDTIPNLLSVKIITQYVDSVIFPFGFHCNNCEKYEATKVSAKIEYLNEKGKIPTPQIERKFLLKYCRRCGYIYEEK